VHNCLDSIVTTISSTKLGTEAHSGIDLIGDLVYNFSKEFDKGVSMISTSARSSEYLKYRQSIENLHDNELGKRYISLATNRHSLEDRCLISAITFIADGILAALSNRFATASDYVGWGLLFLDVSTFWQQKTLQEKVIEDLFMERGKQIIFS